MAGRCSQETCFPEDTGCNVEGCQDLRNCKYYNFNKEETTNEELPPEDGALLVPWTGSALGLTDLSFITASTKPIMIGVAGVASAGKTTFLASLYCLLRHGKKIGEYSFSGSATLTGWENIAWYLSWKNNGNIQFPPHTTSNSGRVPGLLHLALKNEQGENVDLIFTDAPGEWFDHWRNNVNSESAKGAKWIHDNSDAFLLFADCEVLASSKRGAAKLQINSVADRLSENIGERPLGLVWSKCDIPVSEITTQQIKSHLQQSQFTHFAEFQTSVNEGESGSHHDNICNAICWLIEKVKNRINILPVIPPFEPDDLFLSKRK